MDTTAPHVPGLSRDISDAAFATLSQILCDETGIVLSEAKRGLAISRLARRLRHLGLEDFDSYCSYLQGAHGAGEVEEMLLLLTTNVTRFFREPHHFQQLREKILPPLAERARRGGKIRVWSAGCSSGEEPFSIAMTLLDAIPDAASLDIRILATDIDRRVVAQGQLARYQLSENDFDVSALLRSYLVPVPDQPGEFEVVKDVRALVRFATLNLLKPWPMQGQFDVIFCRNVVIYFANDTQQALWPRFSAALRPGGFLMIGHSERVSGVGLKSLKYSGVTQYQLAG